MTLEQFISLSIKRRAALVAEAPDVLTGYRGFWEQVPEGYPSFIARIYYINGWKNDVTDWPLWMMKQSHRRTMKLANYLKQHEDLRKWAQIN